MRRPFLIFVAVTGFVAAAVASPVVEIPEGEEPAYYLPAGSFNILKVLPPPPREDSPQSVADRAIFLRTRSLAGTPRWKLAVNDVQLEPADMIRRSAKRCTHSPRSRSCNPQVSKERRLKAGDSLGYASHAGRRCTILGDGMQKRSKRQREIVSLLRSGLGASVAGLATELDVSDETIRRELRVLEEQGVVIREHGGARLANPVLEGPLNQRMDENADAKLRIARAAANLIEDGAILFIDAGTTSCYIAQQLVDRQSLTIITNSFKVASYLGGVNNNTLFMASGKMDYDYLAFSDHTAQDYVRKFSPHVAILSVGGISIDHGLTDFHAGEAEMSRIAYATSRKVLLAADSTKFDHHAVHRTAAISDVDILVTDEPISDIYAKAFAHADVVVA